MPSHRVITPASVPAAGGVAPRIDGKFLLVEGRRFLIRGVAYGTFAPDDGGAQFPAPARVAEDFAAMAAAGLNTVRTYTVPSVSMLDAAARYGLRVIVGHPWPHHIAFLDDLQLARRIRRDVRADVRRLSSHPAVLMSAIGNEIPPGVVRWHTQSRIERFLRELYADIKSAAPESLLTYVNFPPTDYLEVDCFDVCAFNVFLHREAELRRYLARLQHIAGARPLLLAEAGGDSLSEGTDGQARLVAMQVRTAFAEGACGAVVFSWTDQWWRGGYNVEDWAFGLVDGERRPKPALAAAREAFADAPFPARERARWPKVSVIVCAHNAAETIDDCLTSLAALAYPNVEMIVVNDGSRDGTPALARRHAGVRVVDVRHGGLSVARNVGLAEADGEIVAYTDADVRVDPDWLTYLVQPMLTQDVAGVGGPNVAPRDDPWMAQCVARAPGSPTHVMLDDRVAEHVPGCNMAFRRDALLTLGGFNPVFLRAGDDVDVCWRLQASGRRIGFAPAALVWHHHRSTVGAFWRQQAGYGEAEAWLTAYHPNQFSGGQALWRGRIYSPLPFVRTLQGRRLNTGRWGTAAFPSVYAIVAPPWRQAPQSSVWMAASSALLLAGVLGLLARFQPAAWALLIGASGWIATLCRSVMLARMSDLGNLPAMGRGSMMQRRFVSRAMIAWLHVLQPLARMRGRLRGMWSMPQPETSLVRAGDGVGGRAAPDLEAGSHRDQGDLAQGGTLGPSARQLSHSWLSGVRASSLLLAGLVEQRSFWSESWVAHTTVLSSLATALRAAQPARAVELDDGWRADRDLSVAVGRWGWLHVRALVEEHMGGCCFLRTAVRLRPSHAGVARGVMLAAALTASAGVAGLVGWSWLGTLAAVAAGAVVLRGVQQAVDTWATYDRALIEVVAHAGMVAMPLRPVEARRYPAPTVQPSPVLAATAKVPPAARAALAALALVLVVDFGLGGVSLGGPDAASVSRAAGLVPVETATGGGVAVGIAGDLFVADTRLGLIRRLRPRPPLDDAFWTADDIGSDGDPLLGHAVSFDSAADIAVAPNGDLYIADARRHRVSRIVRATGQIITIAGTGTAGFDGDGGPAVAASLYAPSAVAVGPGGDIYIADTLNNRIRAVASDSGVMTTIAGDGRTAAGDKLGDEGPALQAHLNKPAGLAVAPNGDLYVSDTGHNRVRRIRAATGVISTIAGDGRGGWGGDGGPAIRAPLAAPMGLALVSQEGRLAVYVADMLNNRVRVIGPDGRMTTVGAARILAPTRVAYHPAGWLYVKDASPDGVTAVSARNPVGGRTGETALRLSLRAHRAKSRGAGPPLHTSVERRRQAGRRRT